MSKPQGYTAVQIGLHWLIALLILGQFLFHDGIHDAWRAVVRGTGQAPSTAAMAHIWAGGVILILAVIRIAIKIKRGSPALPADEPAWQKMAAHAAHGLLYLLMLLIPLTGMAAWFGGVEAASEGHEFLTGVLIVIFLIHFGGALYHRVILKSGVMERMIRPNSD